MVRAGSDTSSTLVARLNAELDLRGINQDALADLLGVSQGHLSKILSGETPAGRRTAAGARQLLDVGTAPPPGRWLATVGETARGSLAFKAVVDAALKLAETRNDRRKRRG